MRIENLQKLIDANANLMSIAQAKHNKMMQLKNWIAGFEISYPPTAAQLDSKITKLGMADLQGAFNSEKDVFINPDIIPESDSVL